MATRLRTLVVVAAIVVAGGAAAKTPPVACTGRFAIAGGSGLLGDGTAAPTVVEIDAAGGVSLDPCGTTPGRVKAKRRATTAKAKWTTCGAAEKVVLTAKIPSPACDTLAGSVKRRSAKRARFTATVIACGDGRLDPGEICDATAAGGDAPCPGACEACACLATTTSSSSSTSTTSTTTTSSSTSTTLIDDQPITASPGVWTWIDFPNSTCDEGSTTGIGVNLADSPNVAIILGLGGACWDAQTCWVDNTAVHGPFGPTEFGNAVPFFTNTILDRTLAGNPFATWNLVVVPSCTGDLHAGDNTVVYDTGTEMHTHRHAGHPNFVAFLRRLGPTFPTAEKVVLGGISAGGFGALFNYPNVVARWPSAATYVLDDSGPLLEAASFDSAFLADWFTNWRLDLVTDPICGMACRSDLSLVYPGLAALYPGDRIGLVSSTQDAVVADLFGLTGPELDAALTTMATDRIDPLASVRYYFVASSTHAQLGNPAGVSQNMVPLLDWIGDLVNDDPGWNSVKP